MKLPYKKHKVYMHSYLMAMLKTLNHLLRQDTLHLLFFFLTIKWLSMDKPTQNLDLHTFSRWNLSWFVSWGILYDTHIIDEYTKFGLCNTNINDKYTNFDQYETYTCINEENLVYLIYFPGKTNHYFFFDYLQWAIIIYESKLTLIIDWR